MRAIADCATVVAERKLLRWRKRLPGFRGQSAALFACAGTEVLPAGRVFVGEQGLRGQGGGKPPQSKALRAQR
jgi:hypothetical protein